MPVNPQTYEKYSPCYGIKQLFPKFATQPTISESEMGWSENYWNIALIILHPQILMSYIQLTS